MKRAFFLGLCALWCAAACREAEPPPSPPAIVEDRDPAKLASWQAHLERFDARHLDLGALTTASSTVALASVAPKDRRVLLSFWATYCPPCIAELRSLQLLSDQGRAIIGVSLDADEPEKAAAVLAKHKVSFPNVVLDEASMKSCGAALERGLPFAIVLDGNGRVAKLLSGELTGAHVEAALR